MPNGSPTSTDGYYYSNMIYNWRLDTPLEWAVCAAVIIAGLPLIVWDRLHPRQPPPYPEGMWGYQSFHP